MGRAPQSRPALVSLPSSVFVERQGVVEWWSGGAEGLGDRAVGQQAE